MANSDHFSKLMEGVAVWNEWRLDNSDLQPDLREANLNKQELCGVDFREANLRGADLRGTDLRKASLQEADLRLVNLRLSYLNEANLSEGQIFARQASRRLIFG